MEETPCTELANSAYQDLRKRGVGESVDVSMNNLAIRLLGSQSSAELWQHVC